MHLFENLGINRGGMMIFSIPNVEIVIEELRRLNIEILGLDAFKIKGEYIQPFLEYSLDLSYNTGNSWDLALDHINQNSNLNLYYEIVIDENVLV
jgi:hypothetical protein